MSPRPSSPGDLPLPDVVRQCLGLGLPGVPLNERKKAIGAWAKFQERPPEVRELASRGRKVLDFGGEEDRRLAAEMGLKWHVRSPSGGFHVHYGHPCRWVKTLNWKSHPSLWQALSCEHLRRALERLSAAARASS